MTLQDMMEKRAGLVAEIKKLRDLANDDKHKWAAEDEERWTKVNAEYDALSKKIDMAKRVAEVDSQQSTTDPDESRIGRNDYNGRERTERENGRTDPDNDVRLAFSHWALTRAGKPTLVTDAHVAASKRIGTHPGENEFVIRVGDADTTTLEQRRELFWTKRRGDAYREARALSTQIGTDGGFTIAPYFNAGIESALLYFGPMIQVATPIRTTSAADYPMMTDNETTKSGSYSGENTAITTNEGVNIDHVVFHAYKATTNAILVPYELLRDTSINLSGYLSSKLGERLGRFINTQATTGAIKCKGIVTAAATGVSAASATAITYDDLINLHHSVDIAYRDAPSAAYMMHDNIVLAVRKLKSGTGEYLWSNGTQAGQPDRVNGKPLFVNNDMASSMSSSTVSVIFGDLAKYHIRTVGEIRMTMSSERYWEYDQTAFAAYMYFDGNIVDAGTNPIKKLTH